MSHAQDLPMLDLALASNSGIHFSYAHPDDSLLKRGFIRTVERLTGQPQLRAFYENWTSSRHKGENIFEAGLRLLDMPLHCDATRFADIPRTGPLLVVANHPFGVGDGLAIGAMLTRKRPDVKLICHSLLCQPVEAARYLLPVDFGATHEAHRRSAKTRRDAIEWLEQGHCLIIFPGGAVATRQHPRKGKALEHAWHSFTGRLAAVDNTRILPVFFHGENSTLFHLASHTNYALRVALLFRETLRLIGTPIRAEIGEPINAATLCEGASRDVVTARLHAITMGLAADAQPERMAYFQWPKRLATG